MINWKAKYDNVKEIPSDQEGLCIVTGKWCKRQDAIKMVDNASKDEIRSIFKLRVMLRVGGDVNVKYLKERLCTRLTRKWIKGLWYKVDLEFLLGLYEDVCQGIVDIVYFDKSWEEELLSMEMEDRKWFESFVREVLDTPSEFSYRVVSKHEDVERRVYRDSDVKFVWVEGSPLLVDYIRSSEDSG